MKTCLNSMSLATFFSAQNHFHLNKSMFGSFGTFRRRPMSRSLTGKCSLGLGVVCFGLRDILKLFEKDFARSKSVHKIIEHPEILC